MYERFIVICGSPRSCHWTELHGWRRFGGAGWFWYVMGSRNAASAVGGFGEALGGSGSRLSMCFGFVCLFWSGGNFNGICKVAWMEGSDGIAGAVSSQGREVRKRDTAWHEQPLYFLDYGTKARLGTIVYLRWPCSEGWIFVYELCWECWINCHQNG